MNVFNLFAKLGLNTKGFEEGLDKAGKNASSFSSKMGVAFKNVSRAILAVEGAVSTVAGAIAGLMIKASNYGDEIDKQSQKMGLSAEAYQKWATAAEMAGSNASTLQTGIRQLTKFTQDLTDGTGESLLALQDLGIEYDDFMNASFDEKLKMVVEAMQGLEDGTKKTDLAQQLFGQRAYQELMPLLNQEKGSIDELFASYEDMSLIMDDISVKKSAELNDIMTLLKKQFQMVGIAIGTELYPQMELFIDGMSQILQGEYETGFDKIGEAIEGLLDKVVEALPQILDTASDILLKVIDALLDTIAKPEFLQSLLNVVMQILLKVLDMLPDLVDTLVDLAVGFINALVNLDWAELIVKLIEVLVKVFTESLPNAIVKLIDTLVDLISNPAKLLNDVIRIGRALLEGILKGLANIASSIFGLIFGSPQAEGVGTKINKQSTQSTLWSWGRSIFDGIIGGFGSLAEAIYNSLFDTDRVTFWNWGSKLGEWIRGGFDEGFSGSSSSGSSGGSSGEAKPLEDYLDIPNPATADYTSFWEWLWGLIVGSDDSPEPPSYSPDRLVSGGRGEGSGGEYRMASGGIMDEYGSKYIAGENGAEIVATGKYGTGVANVEQIEEAVYKANERSNRQLATIIVNGIVQGVGRSGGAVNMPEKITVQIGEREFKSAIVSATNSKQFQRGRKTLNGVTGY